ncbi:YqhG family protein [Paenibacillus radicis (ex Xue et al. 2023)]|uniref:YqhG family protein n=1 Tax=Paenibacillus radicis (ex Xue et al. 2023) TaxID=2972489 RepID=A0ABT1YGS8_9BACL|nr:YqhG family protein [Paenibacillus radicis (ex Xue et al. 2023)]MCR8631170.1 YqhG family protein [Paenibacillus radicis (ex Xue et al. 2023)]
MNQTQIQEFVMRYLEAEKCDIVEKHPAYVTVKLSPSADKELTYRPYYWSFVERTGVAPETMTCTFIFDPEGHKASVQETGGASAAGLPPQAVPASARPASGSVANPVPSGAAGQEQQPDSILGRYFGFVPTQIVARVPKDEVTFGSRRLEQIFGAVRNKGRFVHLYEQFKPEQKSTATIPYENWLQVNFKVELACDMKRSEIHSLGIHLETGQIRERFQELLLTKRLTPRLPAQIFIIPDKITLPRAVIYLEEYLEQLLRGYDHRWAQEAGLRLAEEIDRIRGYYETLIQGAEPDKRSEVEAQYVNRKQEIDWQYRPRIQISVINCGLFHLQKGHLPIN